MIGLRLGALPALAPAQAVADLQGVWTLNANGHRGRLSLTPYPDGRIAGWVQFGSEPMEGIRGYYCPAERRAVLLRGAQDDPIQAYVADFQPAEWLPAFRTWQPASLRGLFYALDERGGATTVDNRFAFFASPEGALPGLVVPKLPTVPPWPRGENCLKSVYTFVNRRAEFGDGWTIPMGFSTRRSGCPFDNIQGYMNAPNRYDTDLLRGHYALGSGCLVFTRWLHDGSNMPTQFFVGHSYGGENITSPLEGSFYALDPYAGASAQRMTFDWRAY